MRRYNCTGLWGISIHALLAESDRPRRLTLTAATDFYPRSPCGERQGIYIIWECTNKFLSTLSLRRATLKSGCQYRHCRTISIHALLAESDSPARKASSTCWIFLSTLSLRRATPRLSRVVPTPIFLSTLSLRRATEQSSSYSAYLEISIHALLAESDQ